MNVIPQGPPIKVRITERDKENAVTAKVTGHIVAWLPVFDGDQFERLDPVVWSDGYNAAIPYSDVMTEVRFTDEQALP